MDNGMEMDLLHSRTPYSDATRCRKKKSSNSIKRPMNAFMCFSQWERLKIIRVDPERHNAEISKELGRRWRELSASEKRPFYERSKHLNELHKIEFPDYKYRPRKKRDHSLKLSTAPDGLSVINVSESSSEDNNNNSNNACNNIHNNSINNNNTSNGDKNSKKILKKMNCRGRTRMFSSSMLVQRTLESSKSSGELMENHQVVATSAMYNNGTDYAARKISEHLTEYPDDVNSSHPSMNINSSADECAMRSRSVEHDANYFRSVHALEPNHHWIHNYDHNNENNHFSNNYFPLYRTTYQDDHHHQQQHPHFYNNIRDNFMDDAQYPPSRADYLTSSNGIANHPQLFHTSWAQDAPNYVGDDNLGGNKNPTAFNCNNNNNFYHPSTANIANDVLYAEISHPIKTGFYEASTMEMWQDYPISQTTDYHRSYSVSSASSTSRSPTSNHPHHTDETLYQPNVDSKPPLVADNTSFELKVTLSGTNQFNARQPSFYNPIFAFASHDMIYTD